MGLDIGPNAQSKWRQHLLSVLDTYGGGLPLVGNVVF